MTYTPIWLSRANAGRPKIQETNINVHRIRVEEDVETVRFDDHGAGCTFKVPVHLPMDIRKEATVVMGYNHLIERLDEYRAQAAMMGIDLPSVTINK